MREDLNNHLMSINDLSFLRAIFLKNGIDDVVEYSAQNKTLIKNLLKHQTFNLKTMMQFHLKLKKH